MPEENVNKPLTRADKVQILGATIAAGGVAIHSVALGVFTLGLFCTLFGVAMERS